MQCSKQRFSRLSWRLTERKLSFNTFIFWNNVWVFHRTRHLTVSAPTKMDFSSWNWIFRLTGFMQTVLSFSSNFECGKGEIQLNVFYSLNSHEEHIPVKFNQVELFWNKSWMTALASIVRDIKFYRIRRKMLSKSRYNPRAK